MSPEPKNCPNPDVEEKKQIIMTGKPAVYALTRHGAELAERVLTAIPCKLFVAASVNLPKSFTSSFDTNSHNLSAERTERFDKLAELVSRTFHQHSAHIFITACGIAVRTIAPHLVSKAVDPAVLVLDQNGEYVISLLGGHQAGANKLTEQLAAALKAHPIITTASDCLGLPALDMLAQDAGLKIIGSDRLRTVMAAMVDGSRIAIVDPDNHLGLAGGHRPKCFDCLSEPPQAGYDGSPLPPTIYVGINIPSSRDNLAWLVPPALHVGVGCKRGTSADAIREAIEKTFASNSLSPLAIQTLCSIDAKSDEAGIIEAAGLLNARPVFFAPGELDGIPVTTPSPKAMEQFNIPGVAEPCALLSAGKNARLIVEKQTFPGITIAVAKAANPKQKHLEI